MFERYTERARRVLFFSRYEASQFGSASIESEHLLLGLLRENSGPGAHLLEGLPPDQLRLEIEGRIARRGRVDTSVDIPFSAEMKRALNYAMQEADRLGDPHIGTEHLLLGVLLTKTSLAASILLEHGLSPTGLRRRIADLPKGERTDETGVIDTSRSLVMGMRMALDHLEETYSPSDEAREATARIRRELDALEARL
jgi:ATP-dependent Clp protease ATP-binding subunit ClpC